MNLITIVNILGVIDVILCISDIASTYFKGDFMCKAYDSIILLVMITFLLIEANKAYYF